jgi:hypothetical protein
MFKGEGGFYRNFHRARRKFGPRSIISQLFTKMFGILLPLI